MSVYIDIAVSLIFIFLLLSIVVTAINEIIATLISQRPRMLLRTISVLIDEPRLRKAFYDSGIIVSAKRSSAAEAVPVSEKGHPSYIAAENFAKARTLSILAYKNGLTALDRFSYADLENAVLALPRESKIRQVLLTALSSATPPIADFEEAVSSWYDTSMDRLTGEYARHQKWIAMAVGAVLVVSLNVDIVHLTRQLQVTPALREDVVTQAISSALSAQKAACDVAGQAADQKVGCLVREIGTLTDQLTPVSIGWPDASMWQQRDGGDHFAWSRVPGKLLGWGVAIFAVSLGAPFWFDLLQKIVNIRGAGIKPDRVATRR